MSILLRDLDADGILRLTLNDPAKRNALSEAMLAGLGSAFAEAGRDPRVRVIVLAANGPAFCAGHDLKEMTAGRTGEDRGRTYFTRVLTQCSAVMQGIVTCPKPVIAEVTGIATAAGCQLVASCDLAFAADWFRETLKDKGIRACIPGRKQRKTPVKYDKRRYKRRNRIEIMFGRLKDWRRVATRYDRCPKLFLSAIAVAATFIYWL